MSSSGAASAWVFKPESYYTERHVLKALTNAALQIVGPANVDRRKYFKLLFDLIGKIEPMWKSVCAVLREHEEQLSRELESAFKPLYDICYELDLILPNLENPQSYDADDAFNLLETQLQSAFDILV
jgi:hypothetical protein